MPFLVALMYWVLNPLIMGIVGIVNNVRLKHNGIRTNGVFYAALVFWILQCIFGLLYIIFLYRLNTIVSINILVLL